jgi:anti-sigma factor RsiW
MKPQPTPNEQEHLAVQQVLPWHVAGTLSAGEQAMVAQHLETCAVCRADVALERRLMLSEPGLPDGLDADAALARLMPQLDAVAQEAAPAPASRPGARPDGAAPLRGVLRHVVDMVSATLGGGGWRNWALAGQFAVILGLGVLLLPAGAPDPAYRALGSGTAAVPDVVVMFQPEVRLDHVQQVLQASGARIVDGPTVTGAYLIDVAPGRVPQLLAALRADPAVRLAEPMGAGAAP